MGKCRASEDARYVAFGVAAATMVIVHGLLDPRWRVEVEAEAEI